MRLSVFVLLVTCAAWGQDSGLRSTGDLSRRTLAEQLLHRQTDERIRAYEVRLAASPDDVQLQTGLLSAYLQKLRESADYAYLNRASKIVDRMLEKDGGNDTALRFQNEIDLQRHEFRTVADRSENMLKYAPSDAGIWGNLGDASMELGQYERAGQAYIKMFALRPSLASYNRMAYFRFVNGDAQTAIALMQTAIAAGDPQPENTAWCWAELGDFYFKTGKLEEAADAYKTAVGLFPTLHRGFAGLGKVEAARHEVQAAIRNYEHAQSIVPMVEYVCALEDLYSSAGMSGRAKAQRELLGTIQQLGRANNEKTNRNLALLLADHNRDLEAALELIKAEIPVRGDVYTWDALSWVLFKNGRLEEAKMAGAKALKLGTPEPVFYYHAAKIAVASGDERAAREYSDRLLSLNSKFDFGKAEMAQAGVR